MIKWSSSLTNWILHNSDLKELFEVKQLKGATSSSLYLLRDSYGGSAVIRFYTNTEWLKNEPDLAEHEAASLSYASTMNFNSPKLYAYTNNKDISPYPAVLMSYLAGEVLLPKVHLSDWLRELAALLAHLHSAPISEEFQWQYKPYIDINSIELPSWSNFNLEFQEAVHFAKNHTTTVNTGFIHRDYHPVNVLWHNGKATGIVDWPNACIGPKEVDVGHCRLNLAMLYGVETAHQFLNYYIEETGNTNTEQAYWDLITLFDCLPNPGVYEPWLDFGMTHLSDHLIKTRIDEYFFSIYQSIVKIS
jgi:aminoglycoside phosphotransferase (APT) family kinase protein